VLAVALAAGAVAWAAAVLLAPFALASPAPLASAAAAMFYDAAGLICHQRPERSFHLAGVQLPVCARCAGLYWSAAAGVLAGWLSLPKELPARTLRLVLGLAALPTAATVAVEFLGLASPSNLARAMAALPLGAAGAWLFVSMLRAESSRAVQRTRPNGL
jgi:uncharacterized membrane protein